MLLGQGAAGPYSWNGLVDRLSKWDASGGLALWNAEMDGHLAHERRRLRLIAVVVVLIGLLLALGHLLDHAEVLCGEQVGANDDVYRTGVDIVRREVAAVAERADTRCDDAADVSQDVGELVAGRVDECYVVSQ